MEGERGAGARSDAFKIQKPLASKEGWLWIRLEHQVVSTRHWVKVGGRLTTTNNNPHPSPLTPNPSPLTPHPSSLIPHIQPFAARCLPFSPLKSSHVADAARRVLWLWVRIVSLLAVVG
jgi:hypothetical protein